MNKDVSCIVKIHLMYKSSTSGQEKVRRIRLNTSQHYRNYLEQLNMTRIVKIEGLKKKKQKRQYKERQEQVKFVFWLKKNNFWVSGSGVGVKLPLLTAITLKSMGVAKGYPDIFVPWPVNGYHGFFLEMKCDSGKLTVEQVEWLQYLRDRGYYADLAFGYEDAKVQFLSYLGTPLDAA